MGELRGLYETALRQRHTVSESRPSRGRQGPCVDMGDPEMRWGSPRKKKVGARGNGVGRAEQ